MGVITRILGREADRWPLWLPVFMIIGIAVYFGLGVEPPLWLGITGLAVFGFGSYVMRRQHGWMLLLISLSVVSLGFSAVQWRAFQVDAPVLERKINYTTVQGKVLRVEQFPKKRRITLERVRIHRIGVHKTPHRIRISLQGEQIKIKPGDWISIRASLSPPPAPAAPGAFDFQRQSYFNKLGAVGFSLGKAHLLTKETPDRTLSIQTHIAKWRQAITEKILKFDNSVAGTIATALMTGDRSAIPENTMRKVRESGLAHLLAISGLHIGLVAGILFIGLRGLLVLIPYVALRFSIKKWAAAFAIPGALAYALISGASIPTLRAFLMITLVLLAVMLDRRGISMRMVAWAAAVVLVFQPESVLGPSFQMSFAAVVALIAVYEYVTTRKRTYQGRSRSFLRILLIYVGGVALTTLVAGLATAPFAIFHFNKFVLYGLAANVIAVPVTALWIMPWAVISFLLMPLGGEAFGLVPMLWGVDVVLRVAQTVSAWPGAAITLPAMSTGAILAVSFGLLWLCLWRSPWRYFGSFGIAAGLLTLLIVRPPDILVDREAKLMAVRLLNGQYALTTLRSKKYTREVWLRRIGDSRPPVRWPRQNKNQFPSLKCDGQGCLYAGLPL